MYIYTALSDSESGDWTEQAILRASDGSVNYYFGDSVAISNDTVVVGAPHSTRTPEIGSAYVYVRSKNGDWTEHAKLTASDGLIGDAFGRSVACDVDTIVIGAPFDDRSGGDVSNGGAYVFIRSNNGDWTEIVKLSASDGAFDDSFGSSVAIDGDTIVIGANQVADESKNGRAYVYTRSGGIWTEQTILAASNGASDDRFGGAVAVDGGNIVVGAYRDDNDNGKNSGSVYAFTLS